MKLLIILSRIPWPLDKGDKLRAYHQIRCLSEKNEIILFALNDDNKTNIREAEEHLAMYCSEVHFFHLNKFLILCNMIKAFCSAKPLQVGYYYSLKAKKYLNELCNRTQPDHIYCQLFRTAEYARDLHIPKTLDYQDAFSQGMLRLSKKSSYFFKLIFYYEHKHLQKYENDIFEWFNNKTIISIPDRELLTHPQKHKIIIVPNGVDFNYFAPQDVEKKYDIIFNGRMSYLPNIVAAEMLIKEILPIVRKTLPEVRLLISGAAPPPRIIAMEDTHIHVSRWVDDIRQNYAASRIFVAPMQIGTGLQNKLLEAMSMELPCITSNLANDSLGAKRNEEILIANTTEEYAKYIIDLLTNSEKANTLGLNGRKFVCNTFDWKKLTNNLEKLF